MYIILDGIQPLGKVNDYFACVEFQNRGSPHIHMFIWIEGVPCNVTQASARDLKNYIDNTIHSFIPDCDQNIELNKLVSKLQSHSHTSYCCRRSQSACRFGFPKQESNFTKVFTNINLSSRNKGKFYVTRRGKGDVMINSYNPRANMDIK